MSSEERLRRGDPERAGPVRGWDTLYRRDADPRAQKEDSDQNPGQANKPAWDEMTSRAIERGYEVIEDQIKQGERFAQQFSGGALDASVTTNELGRLLERGMNFYSDFGSLWFELVESLLKNSAITGSESDQQTESGQSANGTQNGKAQTQEHANRSDVAIDLSSPFPTVVHLDLKGPVTGSLVVQALRAIDEQKPALKGISFENGLGPPTLRIRVPDELPADTYSGAILDTRSQRAKGTLSITVRRATELD